MCDKEYTNNRSLKRHIEMYHGRRNEYKCDLCPKAYTSNQSLRRHIKSIHIIPENIGNLKCDNCSDIFFEENEYQSHISSCKQDNWLSSPDVDNVCGTCGIYFNYEPHLRQHVKEEHSFHVFYEYCRDFLLKQEAKNEVLLASRKQDVYYNCEYCNMAFANVYDLKEHMRSKHEKEYSLQSCYVCFSKFYSNETLNEHKKICLPPPDTHNCNYCEKLFTDVSSLDFHKKIFHPHIPNSGIMKDTIDKNNHKCIHCNRVYYSDRSLKHHMKLKHTTDEEVQCGFCGKICNNKYYLVSHIKMVHTDNTISKCDYCDKEFKSKRNIRRHIEYTHLGMQRYKCVECETLFKEKRSLRKHVRVKHPNSTTFPQCHICKKRFESAKSCKIHLKLVHSYNIDSHPCDLCSVSFTSIQALKIHLQSNHLAEDEIYKCEECNMVFKGQENFDSHNDKYHINVDPTIRRKLLPRCVICIKDFSTRKTLKRHIKKFHIDFDVEELANYGTRKRNLSVDCEECLRRFHDEQYSTVHEKFKYAKDMIAFSCGYCGNSYTVLEYTIQRHRIQNFNVTKGKIILSDLCIAEISGEDDDEEGDLMKYPFFQHDAFFEDMPQIKSEPADDIKVEPMSP
ncbi:Zinc finger protein 26 [Eumeta japonica]|uniref:Zinc finger protein 26 n=1 Tax=Eumeta variegata TaxID=151549 RepID=A0A4C1THF4_EUMVA|nr:Zinc finger protein 26 [Eumeta japonica]